eukprot:8324292-Alexandrium_andersonii.AAC.1
MKYKTSVFVDLSSLRPIDTERLPVIAYGHLRIHPRIGPASTTAVLDGRRHLPHKRQSHSARTRTAMRMI